jgi:hypothetical protein
MMVMRAHGILREISQKDRKIREMLEAAGC